VLLTLLCADTGLLCRLLKAASTHAGKTPAAAAMLQAAAALASQQQQQGLQPSGSLPEALQPQQQQQQQPSAAQPAAEPQQQQQQQQQQEQQEQPSVLQDYPHLESAAAVAAAAQRMEGTWHGPTRTASITLGAMARRHVTEGNPLERDLSWHGRTSHMRVMSEHDARTGSKRATEHEEFLEFLEAAKRQRQEQRKVARLVLEGSTHGGVQYFLPARGTSSVAVPAGSSVPRSGPGSLAEDGEYGTDVSDDEVDEGAARVSASAGAW